MTCDVVVQRGPFAFQWRTSAGQPKLRAMDRERHQPQIALLRGVHEEVQAGEIMRQLEWTAWTPGAERLTSLEWSELGPDKAVLGGPRPDPASNFCATKS